MLREKVNLNSVVFFAIAFGGVLVLKGLDKEIDYVWPKFIIGAAFFKWLSFCDDY